MHVNYLFEKPRCIYCSDVAGSVESRVSERDRLIDN